MKDHSLTTKQIHQYLSVELLEGKVYKVPGSTRVEGHTTKQRQEEEVLRNLVMLGYRDWILVCLICENDGFYKDV